MKILTLLYCLVTLAHCQLDGEYHRCNKADGDNVHVPGITVDPCIICICVRGRVVCENKKRMCPSVRGCSNIQPRATGQCCDTCAACSYNGTSLTSGTRRHVNPSNVCEVASCHDGVITKSEVKCDSAPGNKTEKIIINEK